MDLLGESRRTVLTGGECTVLSKRGRKLAWQAPTVSGREKDHV